LWDPPVSDLVGSDAKHLVELKARYEDLGKARALLKGAEHLATVRQRDTYFSLGDRRLKLRFVEGAREGQLIYYERPDVASVKESRVLLATLPDGPAVREILTQVFPVKAEVRKTREIYRLQGVQIHLDTVRGLGKFIEFEKILEDLSEAESGRKLLESLRTYFQIPEEDLMTSSYSDLLESE
jgi:predicted adenylyl cyclase CyaB